MTIWYKAGVMGDLKPQAQKAKGRVARLYRTYSEDLFITCQREGNHSDGNFHETGNAFDFRYPDGHDPEWSQMQKEAFKTDMKNDIGPGFDIIYHPTHIHVEYDPKIEWPV